ncbi:hypothetical protein BZG02_04510 [Labilibaculum filiforme]|uniref:STAS/SEC14 domain-containing protein n=1 Tax=Labilibaculum filiforme TaxID=1940526 RepID=A0A2N3I451_9BACT|nr:STAS/SEC14 domain-containing protein [Labilibaculum filiforme]PKQ65097.1 hypothetical protein BZG02_04510 [Labilibaculum filiforme]
MRNSYYNYVEEHKLLIECFCGETKIKDVFELKCETGSHLHNVPKFSVLADIRRSNSKPSFKEIDEFIELYLQSKLSSKIDRIAIITSTPRQVANAMLIIDSVENEIDIPIKVFSSVESALKWLRCNMCSSKVNTILENFQATNAIV